jgi:hypothetical protein
MKQDTAGGAAVLPTVPLTRCSPCAPLLFTLTVALLKQLAAAELRYVSRYQVFAAQLLLMSAKQQYFLAFDGVVPG